MSECSSHCHQDCYDAPGQQCRHPGSRHCHQDCYDAPGQHCRHPGSSHCHQDCYDAPGQHCRHPGPGCGKNPPSIEVPAPNPEHPHPEVEWIRATPNQAANLSKLAVVGGYEGDDVSPLWVIRARHQGDLVPGKLRTKEQKGYIPWGGQEHEVHEFEVCCNRTQKILWQETKAGVIPPNAVVAGVTSTGEKLYVGRAQEQGNLTPGKVHPKYEGLFISYCGKEIMHNSYEIMCLNNNI